MPGAPPKYRDHGEGRQSIPGAFRDRSHGALAAAGEADRVLHGMKTDRLAVVYPAVSRKTTL